MSEFVRACALSEVPEQGALGVEVGDVPVAIIRADGELFALRDVCSHEEVRAVGGRGVRPHRRVLAARLLLRPALGEAHGPPATAAVPIYQVKIDGDDVLVALPIGELDVHP